MPRIMHYAFNSRSKEVPNRINCASELQHDPPIVARLAAANLDHHPAIAHQGNGSAASTMPITAMNGGARPAAATCWPARIIRSG